MEQDEDALNNQRIRLSPDEKRALLALHHTTTITGSITDLIPADVWRCIADCLGRDPFAFFALGATCRAILRAIGTNFYPVADRAYLVIWVDRLLRLHKLRAGNTVLQVSPRNVFDEKARYIILSSTFTLRPGQLISTYYTNPTERQHDFKVAKVDKYTGLLSNLDGTRFAGYIYDSAVASYFYPTSGHLLSDKDMKLLLPDYPQRKAAMELEYQEATQHLKSTSSFEKKRLFSEVWDESEMRRKRFKRDD